MKKYIGKVYDGLWRVSSFDRKTSTYKLTNIYNFVKYFISYKSLMKVERSETTISRIISNNIKEEEIGEHNDI